MSVADGVVVWDGPTWWCWAMTMDVILVLVEVAAGSGGICCSMVVGVVYMVVQGIGRGDGIYGVTVTLHVIVLHFV